MEKDNTDTARERQLELLESARLSQQKLELHIEHTPLAVIELDVSGVVREWNPAACAVFGFSRDEAIGQHWSFIVPPEMRDHIEDVWKVIVGMRGGNRSTNQNITKDGRVISCEWFNTPLVDSTGRTIGVASLIQDVTERNRAESIVRQTGERFKLLFDSAPIAINVTRATDIVYANPKGLEMFGFSCLGEIGAVKPLELFAPEFRSRILENIQRRSEGLQAPESYEVECIRKDRIRFPVLMYFQRAVFSDGPVTIAFIIDVSARKRVEEELRKNNEELEVLFDASRELSLSLDLKEVCRTLLRSIARVMPFDTMMISSFSSSESLIRCLYVFDKDYNEIDSSYYPPLQLELEGKGPQHVVIRTGKSLLLNDFETHFKSASKHYYVDGNGKVTTDLPEDEERSRSAILVPLKSENRVIGVLQVLSNRLNSFTEDNLNLVESISAHAAASITNALLYGRVQEELAERKEAEEALVESEEKFRLAFMTGLDAIYIGTLDEGRIVEVNDIFEDVFGYSREEAIGKTSLGLGLYANPTDRARMVSDLRATGRVKDLELEGRKKGGEKITISLSASTMLLNDKRYLLGVIRDITEQKKAEERIKASLKEKETLLKEIHHRVKNNMQVISSLLQLQSNFVKNAEDAQLFQDSQERIKSMALVYNRLYQSKDLANLNLREYVTEIVNNLLKSYNVSDGRIEIKIDIDDVFLGLDLVVPCGLILNEVVVNSLKYAFKDGRTGLISISIHERGPEELEIKIADNGIGLPANVTADTSPTLGLMLIQTLVEDQLNGKLDVNRTGGTEYRIVFKSKLRGEPQTEIIR